MTAFKSRFLVGNCYVVHCKRAPFDVYIGRPGPWGNSFPLAGDRSRSIAMYEA